MTLIGHQLRWQALQRAFAKNKIPQTLLLSGPAYVGKTTLLKRFSQLLLCPNLGEENGLPAPCGHCRACHQVEIESYPDFRVFRPWVSVGEPIAAPEALDQSYHLVDAARDFGAEAMKRALIGPRKVLVMFQADRMNEAAQNALLKTFEEPIPGVTYILATDNPRHLRATILSRAWLFPLSLVPRDEIAAWLREEFPDARPQEIEAALQAAAGRPGLAKREMERLSAAENHQPRFAVTSQILERLEGCAPVGALGLTEESLKWANQWWDEDSEGFDPKKLGAKGKRAAATRFLDELALAGRARWLVGGNSEIERHAGALRLDQIRKTRHYILSNANLNLALDVMFGRLIALRPVIGTKG